MLKRVTAALGLALGLGLSLTHACMHPPRDYPGKLGSLVQEYLFYREGDLVHMVANQKITSDRTLPGEVAWVIPLPSVPLEYRTEKDSLFQWLFQATEPKTLGLVRFNAKPGTPKGIIVHDLVQVGKYEIKPVEIVDTASGEEINDWLYNNGYHRVPAQGLKYYLHKGACFLAIKVKNLKRKEEVLRPLHVVYRAKEMRVPLKFFANAGEFDVYLYAMEKEGVVPKRAMLEKWGMRLSGIFQPDSSFAAKAGIKGMPAEKVVLIRYHGGKINSAKNRIEDWKEDPLILVD